MKLYCANGHTYSTERFERQAHETTCPEPGCGARLETGMERNAGKSRTSGLRKDAEPPALLDAHSRFTQLVTEWPCFFRDKVDGRRRRPDHECWGRRDPHHLVPAQWIKDTFGDLSDVELADILYAPIIGVPLCRRAHDAVELRSDFVYRDELDDELIVFCREVERKHPDRPPILDKLLEKSPERRAAR